MVQIPASGSQNIIVQFLFLQIAVRIFGFLTVSEQIIERDMKRSGNS